MRRRRNAVDDRRRSPRARSSRSRRRASPPGTTTAARCSQHRQLRLPPGRRDPSRVRRHLMSGSRRSVPRPEHGASSRTRSKTATEGQRAAASAWTTRTLAAPDRCDGPREQLDAPAAHVAGDDQPLAVHRRRHRGRLAAGRGAGVEDALAGARAGECADELRGFVLDDEQALRVRAASTADCRPNDQAVAARAQPVSVRLPASRSARGEVVARDLQRVRAKRERRGCVVEPRPGLGRLEAMAIQPARRRATRDATA